MSREAWSIQLLVWAGAIASPAKGLGLSCSGPDNWAAGSAFGQLKNAGITDNSRLDFTKTKVSLLASERIGRDLYRQIHRIVFTEKTGKTIEVITSNEASSEECSMSAVEVFVVSRHLDDSEGSRQ